MPIGRIGIRADGPSMLARVAWVLVTAVYLTPAIVANAQQLSTASRHALACKKYPANTFLSDSTVTDQLSGKRLPNTELLALPCSEEVSGAEVVGKPNSSAAEGSLNSLFSRLRTPLERFQNGFDVYSWLTFVALNLPADSTSELGAPEAPTVWETNFYPLDEVMHATEDGANVNLKNLPESCNVARQKASGPEPTMFVKVDEVAFNQPFKTGPLVDQQGQYSLNTIFMNSAMQTFIQSKNHPLDTFHGQQAFKGIIEFPPGDDDAGILGAMMIKASWRVLGKTDDPNEFHTVRAYRYFAQARPSSCDIQTLGLVGFHVVHKTKNRHQWIWTTFEHVRNVPSESEVRSGQFSQPAYFFYDGSARAANATPPQPWDPLHPPAIKSQIVRAQDIGTDTQAVNAAAHSFLTRRSSKPTFWSHYELISTQWPADFSCASELGGLKTDQQADPNCSPAPTFLPNSTLETYVQHDIGTNGGVPQATSSCIACHNNAVAYQDIQFDDGKVAGKDNPCLSKSPTQACSPASDFTFILEQVCAPMIDPHTGALDTKICMRDH
jgi:hypothetical protein